MSRLEELKKQSSNSKSRLETLKSQARRTSVSEESDVNKFISDYENFLKSDYNDETAYDLSRRLTDIRVQYDLNRQDLSEEERKLDSYLNDVKYNIQTHKNSYDRKNEILTADDFDEYSKLGAEVSNPEWKDTFAPFEIFGWKPFGEGEKVSNMVTFAEQNSAEALKSSGNALRSGGSASEHSELINLINTYMTKDEKAIYNYYIGKGETEKAEQYLTELTDSFRKRQAGQMVEQADGKALELVFSAVAGLDQFGSGVKSIDNYITDSDGEATSAIRYAQEEMSANNKGIWKVSNDLAMNIGNMAPSMVVGAFTGGLGGALTLGASAVGNSYSDMRKEGYTANQARAYATLVGASETALQYALGGISKLGGKVTGGAISKFVSGLDSALAKTAIQLGGSMASEGLEESIQTVLEPAFKALTTGEEYEAAEWEEILYSGLLGALSAGVLEGPGTVVGGFKTALNNREMGKLYGGQSQQIIDEALSMGDDSESKALGEKYKGRVEGGKNLKGSQINRMLEAFDADIATEDTSKVLTAVEARLTELGETGDVGGLAGAIYSQVMGEELSRSEKNLIKNSKFGERVANELDPINIASGEYSSSWAENIGTKRLNPESYNKQLYDLAREASGVRETKEQVAVAKNKADFESATGTKFTATESGKTTHEDAEVTIGKVVSTEGGLKVELSNGKTVNASDIEYGSGAEAMMYEMVARMEVSADTANEILSTFKPTTAKQATMYFNNIPLAYKYGTINYEAGLKNINMSEQEKRIAFNRGKMDAVGKAKANTKTATPQSAKTAPTKKNGIIFEDGFTYDESKANELQKVSMAHIEVIEKISNLEVHVFESKVEDGKRVAYVNGKKVSAPNGYFTDGNKIYIDFYAGNNAEGAMLYTMSHEVTHFIRKWNEQGFKELGDFLIEQYGKNKVSVTALIEDQKKKIKKRYNEENKALPSDAKLFDMAYEELVADAMTDMFADPRAYEKLAKLKAQNKTLWEKVGEAIKAVLDKLKSALGIYKTEQNKIAVAQEAHEVRAFSKEVYEKLQDFYLKAFVQADANYEASLSSDLAVVDTKTESVAPIMNSERTWTASEYVTMRDEAAKKIATALGVTKAKALKYIDDVNSIARMIANDRARLDYEASSFGSAFVSNVEYGGSFDYTTLCKKRRIYTGTFTEIQKRLKDTALTPDDILTIRNMLIEAGVEATCGLCYVEGSRANMGKFAKEFIRLYKRDNPLAWIPNMADVNTPDGVEQMRISHPEAYEQYVYFWNHYGKLKDSDPALFASQQKPKLYEARKEYKGEILEHFKGDSTVAKKNLNGGIRMQSFSDFEIVHLIDTMQVIMDMSTVGLAGQAYTKVPEFAKAFGNTGLKINLSLIAKGVDANGKLIFDDREGMPHETAFKLREQYSKNVGTIIVAFTDEQLRAAMADPRIDYIIPFHRSQWKKGQYGAMGLPKGTKDYTFMQNEKLIKQTYHEYQGRMVKDKASNYMPNEYWDFSKSGKENAEAYLKMCAENNKRPKFYKFLDYDGKGTYSLKADGSTDGYWKLLIDFKMYDNDGVGSPQKAVTPKFNMDEAKTMLDEYKGGHASYPVAHSVVDKFVTQYESKSENKFSDRDSTYLDAVNRGDMETAQKMVDEAAREAGYTSPKLYHGTQMFGFTEVKTSGVEKGFAWSPFFAANKEDISASYVPYGKVRDISSSMDYDAIEEARENAIEERKEKISDLVYDFRRLIDRYFSPWVFGQTDNSYLEGIVEEANPEAGYGDGVYDVLSEIVYDTFYDYQDEFGEYEDADDWSENSPEGQEIFSKILEIEGEKSALHRLESGEELGGIYQLYANLDNMYVVDGKGVAWNELRPEGLPKIERHGVKDVAYRTRDVAEWARDNGFDGVIFKNIRDNGAYGRTPAGDIYAFFNPQAQVKSADPVTYDDNGNVIPLSERFNSSNNDIRYSDRDSAGNTLTAEQQEFFKDSKVRDQKGNLMVLYHGTTADFNVFKKGDVGFHFGTKGAARGRVGFGKNVTLKEVYLNITNPIVFDEDLGSWDADYRLTRELYDRGILTQAEAETVLLTDSKQYRRTTEAANKKLAEVLLAKGYDGIEYTNTHESKKNSTSYIIFDSNKAKLTTNKKPTSNPDIRYSDRNPREVTESDVRDILDNIESYAKDSYFPVRINTPKALIDAAKKRGDVIENLPVVMQVKKAQQAMRDESIRSSIERAHGLSSDDMIAILKGMDNPTYIIYQDNGRYAEVVRFETEAKKRAIAILEIGENKNAIHMNGYEGGLYQVLVTAFVPDSYQYIKDILSNKKNTILPIEKKKGSSQRSSGSQVPSLLNESPFFEGIISQDSNSVKNEFSDPDIYYSDRDPNAVSNRTLLAGALESVAQNDIEKTKLAQYKSKIELIESEQAKLEEIKAKANEIRFTKGRTSAETKHLRDLDAEANQIANRISTYDKQLLNLESTTALKNVLEREKTKLRRRLEQKGKEALRAQKEQNAKTVREIMTRNTESRLKNIEGRHKTEMRNKIKDVVSKLNTLLLNPTKEQHVPIGLQLPVAEALDAINMDTMNAAERVAYYNDLIAKSSNPDEIEMLTKKRDFFEYRDANFKERITALKNAYAEFKESDDPLIRNAHNEAIEDLIKNTADAVGNKSLKDMSLAQLEAVHNMYKAILATVRNSNKLFKEGRQETITGNSEAVKTEVKEVGGHQEKVLKSAKFFKKFGWDMLKPVTAMKAIGSKTFEKLFNNVRAAEDTWAVDVNEAKQFYEGASDKYGFKKWDFKKRYSFKDSTGTEFSLSLEQIMSLYAYSKREQADKHLELGGFIFDDAIEVTEKGKLGIPLKYEVNDANPYRLRKEDLLNVTEALTKEQKAFIDEMQTYLSEVMGAKGNEVSLAMYDIKLYNETNYFPLKTSRYFREFDPEKSGTPKIKNAGFSKKTVPQAGNPIVLANFMDVWASHVNEMSMYHAFVLPLEDFLRVYNYSSTAGGYDSVQQYIKNAYGSQANQYIERLLDDLNGGARVDSSAGVINKGISLFKKASVFASASVVVQQPSAIARAMAYINPKYFGTSVGSALNLKKHKAVWAEVKKYAPVAVIKEMGYFDTGVGRSTVEWLKGNKTFKDKMDDVLSKAPAIADEFAWTHIWEAVKKETEAKGQFKVGTEEFLKESGRRFTEVITNTQVYDSVLSRSGMMRSKDTGMKMATAFMAEPTTTVNMMVDGILQGKRGNKKFTAKTVGAISASIILNSILVALVYAARDDEEDETYTEKYIGSLTTELLDGFNPLTYVPFVKDIWSIAQGYDVERSDMSVVSNLWESIEGLFNEDKSGWEKVADTSGAISSLFGIPLKNILRDAKGMYTLGKTVLSDTKTTKSGVGNSIEDSFKSSIPLWDRVVGTDSKSDNIYEAIVSGDTAYAERLKKTYKTTEAYETAVRKALRENDSRIAEAAQARLDGDLTTYTRIAKAIIAEGNFSQDIVVGAINAEMSAIKKGESSGSETTEDKDEVTSIYSASDINVAFANGNDAVALEIIDDLINTKVANGMEEKDAKSSVRSSMTSYWKPLYIEAYQSGDNTEMLKIRRILLSSGLYGGASDVVKTVRNWLKS